MRNNIITSLLAEMEKDENIFFLTADMGINLVEQIQDKFPDRFVNVGIAEQNLIGVAAGLANIGYKPFVYTISNFVIHRCYEQIRNDIILHQYPITLLGTSTGYDNAPLGPTHHIIDEWGALRNFPGIDIYCPGTITFANSLIGKVLANKKPAYIRIPKGEFINPDSDENMVLLQGLKQSVLLVSYGTPAQECIKAMSHNQDLSVMVFNKLYPLDKPKLKIILEQYENILVIEDHFASTGLYGLFCELCNEFSIFKQIISLAPKGYSFDVGSSNDYFHEKIGISSNKILERINNMTILAFD
jgi:transketolase